MKDGNFIERRKEYRLPFNVKIIFTDGKNSMTAYAANLSRGGLFVTSLDPFPIDTTGFIAFFLPNQPTCLCVKAKVVHIVFDRQRCEIECGMGFQFQELNESQKSLLNLQVLNEQSAYLDLKRILAEPVPDSGDLAVALKKLPALEGRDLLHLRYKVNRICTIFEPSPDPFSRDLKPAVA